MIKVIILIAALFVGFTFAGSACYPIDGQPGLWFNANGNNYPCASTTRYWDGFKGACGCGTGDGNGSPFDWQYNTLTAAASDSLYGGGWCGSGCGSCYQITPTGGFVDGEGSAPGSWDSQVLLVSNSCPASDNQQWCSSPNWYGYNAHFDLMDINNSGVVAALGWNNPEVYYQQISCPDQQWNQWMQCQCA